MNRQFLQHHLQRLISLPFVTLIEHFDSIDSTNKRAIETIKFNRNNSRCDACGYLVFVNEQTQGRGRSDNLWFSPSGGLYFSLVLGRIFPPIISLMVGLAVSNALKNILNKETQIKWPNDILQDGKKLSGILIQTIDEHTIIGVGVNTFPDGQLVEDARIPIANEHLSFDNRIDLLYGIIQQLSNVIEVFDGKGESVLHSMLLERLAWFSEKVVLTNPNHTVSGICRGIDKQGKILIETEGKVGSYISGTLTLMDD